MLGCSRLNVTPLRDLTDSTSSEAPRKSEQWKPTAPAEYRDWCMNQGELFRRTVMMLKRWRSEQQAEQKVIKSIVLQVLVADAMPKISDDAARIAARFRNLYATLTPLTQPPVVLNPVLSIENLSKNWTADDFRGFVAELRQAVEVISKAEAANEFIDKADAFRELFGSDFPIPSANQLGLKLEDTSHAKKPSSRSWTETLDPGIQIRVEGTWQRQRRGSNPVPLDSGEPVAPNRNLHFQVFGDLPTGVEIWWQVVNTGEAARINGDQRGEYFKGRDLERRLMADETQNWEESAYRGTHEIMALVVKDQKVIAQTDFFLVPVYRSRK